jgi:hypothetical protein
VTVQCEHTACGIAQNGPRKDSSLKAVTGKVNNILSILSMQLIDYFYSLFWAFGSH